MPGRKAEISSIQRSVFSSSKSASTCRAVAARRRVCVNLQLNARSASTLPFFTASLSPPFSVQNLRLKFGSGFSSRLGTLKCVSYCFKNPCLYLSIRGKKLLCASASLRLSVKIRVNSENQRPPARRPCSTHSEVCTDITDELPLVMPCCRQRTR